MRRLLVGLVVVVLAAAGVAGVVLLLQSRDDAEVRDAAGPGERVEARCPESEAAITHDMRPLTSDQLRYALALGNVVLRYGSTRPPAALRSLQDQLTGPFDAEIAAAGQAVILAPGVPTGVEALAWGRRQRARSPSDPLLREFTETWLGEGAPQPCQH